MPPGSNESTARIEGPSEAKELTAPIEVPPEFEASTAPVGGDPESNGPTARTTSSRVGRLFESIKRALKGLADGFRGTTWDDKADTAINNQLKAFGKLRSLSDADKRRLKPRIEALLRTQHPCLRSTAAVEEIANRITWLLGICAIAIPALVVGLTGGRVWLYIFLLVGLLWVLARPALVLETLTGRDSAGVIWMALVLSANIAAAAWIVTGPGSRGDDPPADTILVAVVAVVCASTALAIVLVARVYVVAWNKAALARVWVEEWLEAAVVSNLLGVVQVLEHSLEEHGSGGRTRPYRPMELSGQAREILADAADAVNDHLPRLIDRRREYSADAQSIASEGAAALLDLRSAVNLPGGRVREEDLARLTLTVEAWSIGSLADLPRKVPSTADSVESSSHRSGLLQDLGKVLLGTLPLILLIALTLLPLTMPAGVIEALSPFAVTWLLVSLASVFAPTDVKLDTRTLFNR